jgi:hypothetical protein
MYPHRIRLRGPWEYEVLGGPGDDAPLSGRVILPYTPGDSDLAGLAGRVRFRRRFGYPGRIDDHERVWVILDTPVGPVRLEVNGTDLGTHAGAAEVDVTQLLAERNELAVDVIDFAPERGLWGEVALEVRCSAYLRNVKVMWAGGEVVATGEVVGTADGPLELYLVADRSPAGYAKADPAWSVQPFALRAPGINGEGEPVGRVKIELVQGAVVWYTVEMEVPEQFSVHPGA